MLACLIRPYVFRDLDTGGALIDRALAHNSNCAEAWSFGAASRAARMNVAAKATSAIQGDGQTSGGPHVRPEQLQHAGHSVERRAGLADMLLRGWAAES